MFFYLISKINWLIIFATLKIINKAEFYQWRAEYRKQAIEKFYWDPEEQFHFDYCWSEEKRSTVHTL